ncbi:hypothetical protein Rs2_18745 [Raphanus sativus]|nr:hypothetical protein Rs2_18745 [Raphanus sativus]
MASSYHGEPQEEEDTFEYHIQDDFDASILTPAQLVMLYELQKEYPGSAKTSLARRIRLELIKDRAELEGREVTKYEFNVAYDLKEVMDWALPLQLEGDELDVDKLFLEIENPLVKNNHENVNIVFYSVDGDRVDYFVKTSFEPVVDFIFPPNAFDSHAYLNIKEHLIFHDSSIVKLFDEKSVYFLWTVVCSFAHLVSCSCRRRTKGALAQPFDTYD